MTYIINVTWFNIDKYRESLFKTISACLTKTSFLKELVYFNLNNYQSIIR